MLIQQILGEGFFLETHCFNLHTYEKNVAAYLDPLLQSCRFLYIGECIAVYLIHIAVYLIPIAVYLIHIAV